MVYLSNHCLSRRETKYIKPYYLSPGCQHSNLDHGLDGQVRSQRTHVLQPRADIFAHLRLPTTLPLPQDYSRRKIDIVTVQQTPIAREDLAVSFALFLHGKK